MPKEWCHASCCTGETELTSEDWLSHYAQWHLDMVGVPSGALGAFHPAVIEAMRDFAISVHRDYLLGKHLCPL